MGRNGETLDVMLSAHRSKKAAKRFFKKTSNTFEVISEKRMSRTDNNLLKFGIR